MGLPVTRYAKSGDLHIAYRVEGDGPFDIVLVPPWAWSIDDAEAFEPRFRRTVAELTSIGRLIQFDKRGVGSSDSVVGAPTLEERMDDVRAVMDTVGSECVALVGSADGSAMSLLFAATFPERTFALALLRAKPRYVWAADYAWAPTRDAYERDTMDMVRARVEGRTREGLQESVARWGQFARWGQERTDEEFEERMRGWRLAMSPGQLIALRRMNMEVDVRGVLGAISVPTLLMYRPDAPDAGETGDRYLMTYMAQQIPQAEVVAVGSDAFFWYEALPGPLKDFLPRAWAEHEQRCAQPQRVLATVLFTDLVNSTARAVEAGPRWHDLLREHNAVIRRALRRFSGNEIDTAGDGFFASGFDGPARAIRCGCAIRDAISALGLGIRVGVHTGECDVVDGKLSGLGVVIGSRVATQAEEGQVLVSGTVRDLVAGSGIQFEPRGVRELKGLGEWPLYVVTAAD
jgi:class 3 adenylate cyclase